VNILLDELFDEDLVADLASHQHRVVHVGQTRYAGSSDPALVPFARDFDVFITLDLHRQEAEWVAVNRGLLEGGLQIVRLRLPRRLPKTRAAIRQQCLESLLRKFVEWESLLRAGACLITITHLGTVIRARTPAEVQAMLAQRFPS
jgi:hypothetical protein